MAKKALVADSDVFYVDFIADLLENRGYVVKKAYNGKEAISHLSEQRFDVVFTDVLLPVIDGTQVIAFILNRFFERPIPVIAVSGAIVEQIGDIDTIGANYYLAKGPVSNMAEYIHELVDKIEQAPLLQEFSSEVIEPCKVYPRRATSDLLASLKFVRSMVESLGAGVLAAGRDTRIVSVNNAALEILKLPFDAVINRPVAELIPQMERPFLVDGLKSVLTNPEQPTAGFSAMLHDRPIRFDMSLFKIDDTIAGWVICLYKTDS